MLNVTYKPFALNVVMLSVVAPPVAEFCVRPVVTNDNCQIFIKIMFASIQENSLDLLLLTMKTLLTYSQNKLP